MDDDNDDHDSEFAALIGEVDGYDTVVSAAVGAARDLARELEEVLLDLEDSLHDLLPPQTVAGGEELGQVRLEIEVAHLALMKLAQISNALDAVEARRGL